MMTSGWNLNDRQREVVEHGDGPLLVLAGAGSGKTRAITHRIAHLILERGLHSEQVLAVTFTNKAAGEMKERVHALLGDDANPPTWISTFHSACARILRYDAPRIGIPRSFTIFDDDDQKRMIKKLMVDLRLPSDELSASDYQYFIERARNQGWLPPRAHELGSGRRHEMLADLYAEYHRQMRRNGTLDFGDLLLATIELLETDRDTRERYLYQWRYVLVDEFQDTNPAQYRLLRLLCDRPHNLTVVGDDDQSIYAWRGAAVTNLLGFENDFDGCRVVRLEQNYRSTQPILDFANAVIAGNRGRKAKTLWTDRTEGPLPRLFSAKDDREEAQYIARAIERLVENGSQYGDIALFYRTNALSRIYEEQLRQHRIPYCVVAGTSFYAREEVKDVLAYLRAAVNPADTVAVLRMINVPKRGCGKKTLAHLQMLADVEGIPVFEAIRLLSDDRTVRLSEASRKALQELCEVLDELRSNPSLGPAQSTQWLLETIGYQEHLRKKHAENFHDRWDNVSELISAMAAYEYEMLDTPDETPTIQGFLERAALVQMNDVELSKGTVSLMTIHAAKGLEFPTVFLASVEDGSIPLVRGGSGDPDDLEEERRLCYVAVTRAKDRLVLTNCRNRRVFGSYLPRRHSRFLDRIPGELFDTDGRSFSTSPSLELGRFRNRRSRQRDFFDQREYPEPEDLPAVEVDYEVPPDGLRFNRPTRDDSGLDCFLGRTAKHGTFGLGRVLSAEYSGSRVKLTIDFANAGVKKVISTFVELV